MIEPAFDTLFAATQDAVQTWHHAHPEATLAEMDAALYPLLMQLQADLMGTLAQHHPEANWAQAPVAERPCCPTCHVPLQPHGRRRRRLQGRGGGEVALDRTYGVCPQCETGFFPPGRALGGADGTPDSPHAGIGGVAGLTDAF